MILRIYKTHDHDLMSLHQTGALDVGKAAKAAVIAYFKGERFQFDFTMEKHPDSKTMPTIASFQIEFDDILDEAPGISEWLNTFEDGYRNCCIKSILRFYLADPCVPMFRKDEWQPGVSKESGEKVAIAQKPKRSRKESFKKKETCTGISVLLKEAPVQALSTIKEIQKKGNEEIHRSMQSAPVQGIPDGEEEDFDAFTALFELRKGNE